MANEKRLIDIAKRMREWNELLEAHFPNMPCQTLGEFLIAAPTVEAIVLPCKVGSTVYRIYDDCDFPGACGTKMLCKGCHYRNLFIEKQAFCLSMLSQNGKLEHPYYLTSKEAKVALAKMDGERK